MREILFRGKRIDNGKWIEGCLLKVTLSGKTAYLIFGDEFGFAGTEVEALCHALVGPETVGQYTGVEDKNGRKIFEGDIVMIVRRPDYFDYAGVDYNALITFAKGGFCITNGKLGLLCQAVNMGDFEVIGNIHDNPEMMEAEE